MDHSPWFYQKDNGNQIEIHIDKFLSTWWVKDILTQDEKEQSGKSIQHCNLPVNVSLFLKWLLGELLRLDPGGQKKVVFESVNELHLDYLAAMTLELQGIMREDSIEPKIKDELLTMETFLPNEAWPKRWYIHIKWSLKQIPDKFWNLVHVELVDFDKKWNERDEALGTIPYQIGRFKDLKYLACGNNQLKSLPSSLQFCQSLERLDISDNKLEELPLFLLDLPKLEFLYRSYNPLSHHIKNYDLQSSKIDGVETVEENEEVQEVDKLVTIAANFICKQKLFSSTELQTFNIPKQLQFHLQYLSKSWNYCYACRKGITEDGEALKFWFTMENFVGNSNIPVFCCACSSCKEDVEKSLLKMKPDLDTTEALLYKNPDVSIEKLHIKNCSYCKFFARVKSLKCF